MTKSKNAGDRPNPEVPERAKRRRFSPEYKLKIVQEADRCTPGEVGALLRREGLYSSHLSLWRKQRDEGALSSLPDRRRRGRGSGLGSDGFAWATLATRSGWVRCSSSGSTWDPGTGSTTAARAMPS